MLFTNRIKAAVLFAFLMVQFSACSNGRAYTPLLKAEPEIGSVVTRLPRTLRLYFDALPDVSRSSVSLQGPAGEYQLRGMHTMSADDLMMEIFQPTATDGEYTVQWTAVVADDPTVYRGSYSFTYKSN